MRFDIITIFPEAFTGILQCGILRRALESGQIEVRTVNLRDFADDRHRSVDDRPYGGGEGMVFMPGPLFKAVEFCREQDPAAQVVLLTPQGATWSQPMAAEYASLEHIVMICGRYEGIDQRVVDSVVDREVSVGDFVLSGGELAAMVILDCVARLIPGVLGDCRSAVNESFSSGLLDCPQYTRPAVYEGMAVPDVLLSGDHARIEKWRSERALEKTRQNRPELIRNCEAGSKAEH
jgi:tRNA (guanine37-N1)-methyltransferase